MSLTIRLSEPAETRLASRAAEAGQSPAEFAAEVIERELARPRTLAEIMAPFAAEFAASGMTEEELDVLIEEAREEVWHEWKRKGKA